MSETRTAPVASGTATYTAALYFEEGWWWAQIVEVPEAFGQGRTVEECRSSVAEALEAALELRREQGKEIPASALSAPVSVRFDRS